MIRYVHQVTCPAAITVLLNTIYTLEVGNSSQGQGAMTMSVRLSYQYIGGSALAAVRGLRSRLVMRSLIDTASTM